ncbi:MAG: GyrI-like domain-containing protein [FCB group bacterium]|jgi:effector-binding domain-containing protein
MKALKVIIIIILSFVVLYLISSIFLPSQLNIEKTAEINSPVWVVYPQINELKNWEKWDPWMALDAKQKRVYSNPSSGKGAFYTWESDNSKVGKGKLIITDNKSYKNIDMQIDFDGRNMGKSSINFEDKYGITIVKWSMESKVGFFERWFGLMMKGTIGTMFEKGVAKLKDMCEHMPAANISISITNINPQTILFIPDSIKMDPSAISMTYGNDLAEINGFIQKNKIVCTGPPLAIALGMDNNTYSFDAGIPIMSANIKPEGRIKIGTTPSGKVLLAIQTGPYQQAKYSYQIILNYMKENNLKVRGHSWESYVNDPGAVKPDEILTYVYFPIE